MRWARSVSLLAILALSCCGCSMSSVPAIAPAKIGASVDRYTGMSCTELSAKGVAREYWGKQIVRRCHRLKKMSGARRNSKPRWTRSTKLGRQQVLVGRHRCAVCFQPVSLV